jgi:hypothetical protein
MGNLIFYFNTITDIFIFQLIMDYKRGNTKYRTKTSSMNIQDFNTPHPMMTSRFSFKRCGCNQDALALIFFEIKKPSDRGELSRSTRVSLSIRSVTPSLNAEMARWEGILLKWVNRMTGLG